MGTKDNRHKAVTELMEIQDLDEMVDKIKASSESSNSSGFLKLHLDSTVGHISPSITEVIAGAGSGQGKANGNTALEIDAAFAPGTVAADSDAAFAAWGRPDILYSKPKAGESDGPGTVIDLLQQQKLVLHSRAKLKSFIEQKMNSPEHTQVQDIEKELTEYWANPFSRYNSNTSAKGIWIRYKVKDVTEDKSGSGPG